MNYNKLNLLFYRIDKSRKIQNILYKNSLAWIIVREAIFNTLIFTKKKENNSIFFNTFFAIRGAIEFLINYLFCEVKDLGLFYSDRSIKIKDTFIHPHIGNIKKIENKKKIFHFYYPFKNTFGLGRINNFFFDKFISLIIKFKSTDSELTLIRKNLTTILKKNFPDIDEKKISNIITRELKKFSIKTFLLNKLFKSLRLKKMIITDADAKIAEIYVCKLLNIKVTEIQHGVIFKNESGYTWDKSYKNNNTILPIPDEIIVFGKFWKRQVLENGYFLSKDIIISTNIIIKMYRKLFKKDNKDFKMLLISQDYVRKELIKIIENFLINLDQNFKRKIKVSIKLHPNEFHNSAFEDYKILVTKYPDFVEILRKKINVYDQISKSDIVMGHTSFLLFESIGLGIPALVLGNKNKNSILDIYDKKIIENFEIVNNGNELLSYITKSKKTKISNYFSLKHKLTEDLISSK